MQRTPKGSEITKIACSFGLVVMFHFNHFRNLAVAENRFYLHWSSGYALKFILFLCLHTLIIYLFYRLIKKIKPELAKPLFIFVSTYFLLYSVLGIIAPSIDLNKTDNGLSLWLTLPYLIPLILAGIYIRLKIQGLYMATKVLVLIWAAIGLSLSVSLFFYPNRGYTISDIEKVKNIPHNNSQTPVFVFLFDNWSGPRIYLGLRQKKFPNLEALLKQSDYLGFAISPAQNTQRSLPGVLFQNPGKILWDEKKAGYFDAISGKNSRQMESIFTLFRNEDYFTAMVGAYHPYSLMIKDKDLDFLTSYTPYGSDYLTTTFFILDRSLQYASDPVIRKLAQPIKRYLSTQIKYFIDQGILKDVYHATSKWNGSLFAFFHILVPHAPFIYREDGSVVTFPAGKVQPLYDKAGSEDYEKAMKYTDTIIGDIIKNLKSNGMFDKSMLVFLSDHNYKWDYVNWGMATDSETHVPLIIKKPYQQTGNLIVKRVAIHEKLKPLFQRMLNQSKQEEGGK